MKSKIIEKLNNLRKQFNIAIEFIGEDEKGESQYFDTINNFYLQCKENIDAHYGTFRNHCNCVEKRIVCNHIQKSKCECQYEKMFGKVYLVRTECNCRKATILHDTVLKNLLDCNEMLNNVKLIQEEINKLITIEKELEKFGIKITVDDSELKI